jgi:hypothetical protein
MTGNSTISYPWQYSTGRERMDNTLRSDIKPGMTVAIISEV